MPTLLGQDELRALCIRIAAYLGDEWHVPPAKPDEPQHFLKLLRTDGSWITAEWSRTQRDKLCFSGGLTQEEWQRKGYNEKTARIYVSAEREPKSIARDIERRLLPAYYALRNALIERVKDHNAYEAETRSTLAEVAKAFNTRLPREREGETLYVNYGECYGDIRVSGNKIGELKLRGLTKDQALAIARIIIPEGGQSA